MLPVQKSIENNEIDHLYENLNQTCSRVSIVDEVNDNISTNTSLRNMTSGVMQLGMTDTVASCDSISFSDSSSSTGLIRRFNGGVARRLAKAFAAKGHRSETITSDGSAASILSSLNVPRVRDYEQNQERNRASNDNEEFEDNSDAFENSNIQLCEAAKTICFYEKAQTTSYWIGCEYKYLIVSERLKLIFRQIGRLPLQFRDKQHMYMVITLGSVTRTVRLGRVGKEQKKHTIVYISGFSNARLLQMDLQIELFVRNSLFKANKQVMEWTFPLRSCYFLSSRSEWANKRS